MAIINVKVSADNMVASINLIDNGKKISMPDIETALKENNVVSGIRYDIVSEIISAPKYSLDLPIAYGHAPKVGENGGIKLLAKKKKQNMEKKYIDLRERTNIISIEKDEIIAEIIPPTQGEPGMDVYGNEIEGVYGKDLKIKLGKNVINKDGKIIAQYAGELIYKKEIDGSIFIDVSRVYTVDGDVDYSTGNIRFPGKVTINGSVKPGFMIEAEGDIEIKGVVESATLISEGTIIVSGIKGAGKGIIKAKNVIANYIENATIEAEDNIKVKQSIINSNLKSGNSIIVTGKNGRILGGVLNAMIKIEADILGSERTVKTHVEVGVDPHINEEITIIKSQIALDLENLKKLSLILKGIMKLKEEGKMDKNKLEQYKKTLQTAKNLKNNLEENEKKMNELQKIVDNSENKGLIKAKQIVYPGVEIYIHKRTFFPSKALTKTVFYLADNQIMIRGYNE